MRNQFKQEQYLHLLINSAREYLVDCALRLTVMEEKQRACTARWNRHTRVEKKQRAAALGDGDGSPAAAPAGLDEEPILFLSCPASQVL